MPELARGYFPSAVPGRSEEMTNANKKCKNVKIRQQNWTTDANKVTKKTKKIKSKISAGFFSATSQKNSKNVNFQHHRCSFSLFLTFINKVLVSVKNIIKSHFLHILAPEIICIPIYVKLS